MLDTSGREAAPDDTLSAADEDEDDDVWGARLKGQ